MTPTEHYAQGIAEAITERSPAAELEHALAALEDAWKTLGEQPPKALRNARYAAVELVLDALRGRSKRAADALAHANGILPFAAVHTPRYLPLLVKLARHALVWMEEIEAVEDLRRCADAAEIVGQLGRRRYS